MVMLLFAIYVASALAGKSGKGGSISSLSSPPLDEAAWQGVKITDVMPGFRYRDLKPPTKCSRQASWKDTQCSHFQDSSHMNLYFYLLHLF
eukprot:Skav206681  [mRNA]  locus=scaffold1895:219432:220050:+ [translate_table: standard]